MKREKIRDLFQDIDRWTVFNCSHFCTIFSGNTGQQHTPGLAFLCLCSLTLVYAAEMSMNLDLIRKI